MLCAADSRQNSWVCCAKSLLNTETFHAFLAAMTLSRGSVGVKAISVEQTWGLNFSIAMFLGVIGSALSASTSAMFGSSAPS